jgi:hypothetical protein
MSNENFQSNIGYLLELFMAGGNNLIGGGDLNIFGTSAPIHSLREWRARGIPPGPQKQ